MIVLFISCFAPVVGEWGWFNVEVGGDCSLDQAETPDEWVEIGTDDNGFSLSREFDTFSCALDGTDFECSSSQRTVESDEVTLTVSPIGSGSFSSTTEGTFRVEESWSCTAGECETYGLESCVKTMVGALGFSE